ncbi:MAE_28990/MAE_18760 family HEPN-like nuclease [Sphingobium sp. KCTC 72723]|uniref:MAE_28990/MAE_18760 family HEPN-like nuclease n=1 Tax=Sphingobium sp. KCTC 72723 TaxID=2733867 RepID=UPI00165D40FD|nr:MAE_28990/MAE_18760 family HEPN-like nuclease [Sphingobium sp. KCTC 72723]
MAKIRSLDQLQDTLDGELGWRIKEVLNLKMSISGTKSLAQSTLIRAGIALLYAHWEGFIKSASLSYAEYVSTRGLKFEDLKPCFIVLGLRGRLELLAVNRKNAPSVEALHFVQSKLSENAIFNLSNAINTESNLSSSVFENISGSIGIDTSGYSSYYNLIDESLLKRRNKVAHGEYLDINAIEWKDLADTIIQLMRSYKTDIQNAATLGSFKAP